MMAVRKMQLVRLGVWAGVATIAVLVATIAANTETGIRRIAGLMSTEAPAEPVRGARSPQLTGRFDAELETRRVSEAVRVLSADRDRLLARVAVLERNLEDVTGSISAPPPAATAKAAPPLPQIPPQAAAPPPAPAPSAAAAPAPTRVTTTTVGPPGPAQSIATKTDFGVDIGGNTSLDGLRVQWTNLKASQPALLEGLRPVIAIREGGKGAVELRLVAGPLANASAAARLCASLAAVGQACQPTVFDGQRLALQ
ncbi:MAG: hypothetical protein QOG38_3023 [Hyphomicrobiales bacterium]|nr:hypothetical protein [Hyphomicrobiales bacterium]